MTHLPPHLISCLSYLLSPPPIPDTIPPCSRDQAIVSHGHRRGGPRRRLPVAHRARAARPAAVALDGGRHHGASRLRQHVPRARRAGDGRRGHHPRVREQHARAGTRSRAAAPGGARRLHGLGHGDLGQRRAEAAGLRLPLHVARLGPRAPHRRWPRRTRGRGLSRRQRAHAALRLGRLVRLPAT